MTGLLARPRPGARAVRGVRRLLARLGRDERRHRAAFYSVMYRRFGELGAAAGGAFGQVKQPDEVTVTQIMALLDVARFRDVVLRGEFERLYARIVLATGETIEAVVGLGISIPDPVAREIVRTGGRRAGLIDVDAETRAALFRALEEGRAAGEGPAVLARRLERYVAGGRFHDPRDRARLIARTETKYAQNVSTLAAYETAPAFTGVVAYDNRTGFGDPDCSARDGQFFTFDDAAIETDNEHPNGTLSWGPATGGP